MGRRSNPSWYETKKAWYATILGERKKLGLHPEGAPKPVKSKRTGLWNAPEEINRAFRRLMGKERPTDDEAVALIFEDFLAWTKRERASRTYDWHKQFCEDFAASVSPDGYQYGHANVHELTPKDVNDWLASKDVVDPDDKSRRKPWGAATRKCAITSLSRAFNWAKRNRGLKFSPIEGMEKPSPQRKIVTVSQDEFDKLIAAIPTERMSREDRKKKPFDDPFKDLVTVAYDCGCRPEEIRKIEAAFIQDHKAIIPKSEAKGRRRDRVIFFPTERSWAIIQRLAAQYPNGPIFRNKHGRPWTASAWKNRFWQLEEKIGRKIKLTELRKTWITAKILAGTDSHVVAKLSGHASTRMIDEHYSGVGDDHAFLLEQAKRGVKDAAAKDPSAAKGRSASAKPSSRKRRRPSPKSRR